jgi:predicted 3-demethylubiquinone-9 3-methyltransferase (glyoxalase superfamily)
MQKISPFLWFNFTAEEAVNFFVFHLQEIKNYKRFSIW